ncbi:hypothetical protein BH09ACT8_BH09ACT8_37120 [soil metagenome]
MSERKLVASVLPADFANLGRDVEAIESAGIDRIQWDVMDGSFVPNITFGPDVIAANRDRVSIGFEAHLMVRNPDPMLSRWVEAGCEIIIVHAAAAGASVFCAGSALFDGEGSMSDRTAALRAAASERLVLQ